MKSAADASIRELSPHEASAMCGLYTAAYGAGAASGSYPYPQMLSPTWMSRAMRSGALRCLADGGSDGVHSGIAIWSDVRRPSTPAEVFGLVVGPDQRGTGLARGLIQAAADSVIASGRSAYGEIRCVAPFLLRLADEAGYGRTGVQPHAYQMIEGWESMIVVYRTAPLAFRRRFDAAQPSGAMRFSFLPRVVFSRPRRFGDSTREIAMRLESGRVLRLQYWFSPHDRRIRFTRLEGARGVDAGAVARAIVEALRRAHRGAELLISAEIHLERQDWREALESAGFCAVAVYPGADRGDVVEMVRGIGVDVSAIVDELRDRFGIPPVALPVPAMAAATAPLHPPSPGSARSPRGSSRPASKRRPTRPPTALPRTTRA